MCAIDKLFNQQQIPTGIQCTSHHICICTLYTGWSHSLHCCLLLIKPLTTAHHIPIWLVCTARRAFHRFSSFRPAIASRCNDTICLATSLFFLSLYTYILYIIGIQKRHSYQNDEVIYVDQVRFLWKFKKELGYLMIFFPHYLYACIQCAREFRNEFRNVKPTSSSDN